MPIIWRYLLSHYFKVLILCAITFIALLMTLRLEEIAHFATLGPEGLYILYFTLYQIPYILPIALPISALISAIILIQQLSKNHELTALRASGISLQEVLTPLLIAASIVAICNFYVVSELATNSHLASSLIKNELRSINPLLLLSNKHLMKLKGIYFDTLGASRAGESASDIIIAMPNKNNQRISVLIADNVHSSVQNFNSKGVTLISSLEGEKERRDRLLLEHIDKTETSIKDFTQMIQKKVWTLNNDHLRMSLLLTRLVADNESLKQANRDGKPVSEIKQIKRSINRIHTEMIRRFSVALAVVTFTLMGASCGINISRNQSRKGIVIVILLAALYVAAYFSAKGIDHLLIASSLLYTVPHLLMITTSLWMLQRASKGIE